MTNPKRPEADTPDVVIARLQTRVEELEARCLELASKPESAYREVVRELTEHVQDARAKLRDAEQALAWMADGCLVPPDGGSPCIDDFITEARECLQRIRSAERVCDHPALVGTEKNGYVCVRCNQNETERGEHG